MRLLCNIFGHKALGQAARIPSIDNGNNYQSKMNDKSGKGFDEFYYTFCYRCRRLLSGQHNFCKTGNKFFDQKCMDSKCNEDKNICPFIEKGGNRI